MRRVTHTLRREPPNEDKFEWSVDVEAGGHLNLRCNGETVFVAFSDGKCTMHQSHIRAVGLELF